jgi:hypothetical protein
MPAKYNGVKRRYSMEGNNPSKKHHYLPRHYLKGFTGADGTFFVYDKQADKIFSATPNNSFFENDLNTITFPGGERSDFLENAYSYLENGCWQSFDRIRSSDGKTPVDNADMVNLLVFLSSFPIRG